MSRILLCLAILFSAKLVFRGSDTVQDCYSNGGRSREGVVLAVVPQAIQVDLDPRSTVFDGQGSGIIDRGTG